MKHSIDLDDLCLKLVEKGFTWKDTDKAEFFSQAFEIMLNEGLGDKLENAFLLVEEKVSQDKLKLLKEF